MVDKIEIMDTRPGITGGPRFTVRAERLSTGDWHVKVRLPDDRKRAEHGGFTLPADTSGKTAERIAHEVCDMLASVLASAKRITQDRRRT